MEFILNIIHHKTCEMTDVKSAFTFSFTHGWSVVLAPVCDVCSETWSLLPAPEKNEEIFFVPTESFFFKFFDVATRVVRHCAFVGYRSVMPNNKRNFSDTSKQLECVKYGFKELMIVCDTREILLLLSNYLSSITFCLVFKSRNILVYNEKLHFDHC